MNRVDPCHSCHRSLIWLHHARTGNVAPIEFQPAEKGNVIPVDDEGDATPIVSAVAYRIRRKGEPWDLTKDGPLYISHFANCPDAPRFHRPARSVSV